MAWKIGKFGNQKQKKAQSTLKNENNNSISLFCRKLIQFLEDIKLFKLAGIFRSTSKWSKTTWALIPADLQLKPSCCLQI